MSDPFSGGFDPRMFEHVPLFRELAKVMSWGGGPVNWDLAAQTASAVAGPVDTPSVERDEPELTQAVGVAELWLDQVTTLPTVSGSVRSLGRAEWVREACSSSGLGVYVEPVAEGMGAALGRQLGGAGLGDLSAMGGPVRDAMNAMGAMLYGVQVGTVAGHLSGQLLGTYDLGVPTLQPATIGTVGDNALQFARDYEFDETEFRYWLALREAAHRRQFAGVAWLRPHVAGLIRGFAEGAEFDPGALLEQLGGMGFDPSDPDAIREALEGPEAFRVEPTAAQKTVLRQLQALVAFTGAWVDTVVRRAAGDKLSALGRIEEAMLRRRAEKGPGERFMEQLIGLDLKPSDHRLGQRFCQAVLDARGQEGLDRAWQRSEWLPSHAELEEPSRWLVRLAGAELADGGE
jgi:putative hydrolase